MAVNNNMRGRTPMEIILLLAEGDIEAAVAWYETYAIPAFGGRAAKELALEGKNRALCEYLEDIGRGSFA